MKSHFCECITKYKHPYQLMRQERYHIGRISQFITRLLVISQKLSLNIQIEIPPNKRISVANIISLTDIITGIHLEKQTLWPTGITYGHNAAMHYCKECRSYNTIFKRLNIDSFKNTCFI